MIQATTGAIGLICPNCRADESVWLHQRLKSYRGRPPIHKCHNCKNFFTEPLADLLREAGGLDKPAGG